MKINLTALPGLTFADWSSENATPNLRYLNGVLQQMWVISSNNDHKTEWRDVPVVTEDANE